tara:strand:+ start:498 stop:701 length:204 start_codon:yes stop_codon:yes gene_type:complete
MTFTTTIELTDAVYFIEYAMSCVTKSLTVVYMSKNGKFHRMNWIKDKITKRNIESMLEMDYEKQTSK